MTAWRGAIEFVPLYCIAWAWLGKIWAVSASHPSSTTVHCTVYSIAIAVFVEHGSLNIPNSIGSHSHWWHYLVLIHSLGYQSQMLFLSTFFITNSFTRITFVSGCFFSQFFVLIHSIGLHSQMEILFMFLVWRFTFGCFIHSLGLHSHLIVCVDVFTTDSFIKI